jgi:hypothetical protein
MAVAEWAGTGRHRRLVSGPPVSDRLLAQLAGEVAVRFLDLHPEVDVVDEDLAAEAAEAVLRWERNHGERPSERRALALMRSELFRHLPVRPGRRAR